MHPRVDNPAISFSPDHGIVFFHYPAHIHLSHRGSKVPVSIFFRDIFEGPGGGEVRHRIARCFAQDVVSHGYQGVFFPKYLSPFIYHGQSINIRIYYQSHVSPMIYNCC